MNRSLGAVLIAFSLFLSGCTSETDKPLDPLQDEDGDGLSNGWELDRGFDPRNASDVLICQGQAKFCERQYDNHTFPETHNSFSTFEDDVWMAVNHYTALQAQWDGGIRAFMIDIHHLSNDDTEKEDVRFCHGSPDAFPHPCMYSEVDAFAWLSQLNSLMNNSSGDVVTLLIENYVPGEQVDYLFNVTGMRDKTWVHQVGEDWPMLGDMVLNEKNTGGLLGLFR